MSRADPPSPDEASAAEERAFQHVTRQEWAAARDEAGLALRLRVARGDQAGAARARYALGLVGLRAGDGEAVTRAHFEAALGTARALGDQRLAGRCLGHLTDLALRAGDLAGAEGLVTQAASAFAEAGDTERLFASLRLRTFLFLALGRPRDAFVTLTRATEMARRYGTVDQALELRMELHNLSRNPLFAGARAPESLSALLREAEAAGRTDLVGYLHLSRGGEAAQAGDRDRASQEAGIARELALQGPDPALYLMACLLQAELHEARGDRVAALTTLFTCQATLGDLLGDAARVPVLAIIDSLETKWGKPAFDAAMTAYRAQFP